jgi:hypothetical protein
MCVREQLRECGSVPVKTLRTRKFVSFIPVARKRSVGDTESGILMRFTKLPN